MKLEIAQRTAQKLRLALQGPSGSGKTYSALLLAYGLFGNWHKIAVIDTEQASASLYSSFGPFHTVQISQFFQPLNYLEALKLCEQAGIEVVILDSISPEWVGALGIVDQFCSVEGDLYRRWDEVIHRHREFIQSLQFSPAHIIATVREVEGKALTEPGYEHYFTTVLGLDPDHFAGVIKDRTGLFREGPVVITVDLGERLREWCEEGEVVIPESLQQSIDGCTSLAELYGLLFGQDIPTEWIAAFTKRRLELEELNNNTDNRAA